MHDALKSVAHGLALLIVSPLLVWHGLLVILVGRDRAVQDTSQIISLAPGIAGEYLRRALLSRTLAACHQSAVIGFGSIFSKADARVGARAYIGSFCTLGLVTVEEDVLIASGVQVPSGPRTHGIEGVESIRDQQSDLRRVTIGRGSWIGNNAVVMASVGADSVIGAGSVVTREIPPGVVAAGVPARVLRTRTGSRS